LQVKIESAHKMDDAHFVYIKIPEPLMPLERGARYGDPLDASLAEADLGEITGGGAQLGDTRADGTRPIEFCGIDVDLIELDSGLELLRKRLVELGAPPGTELHYTRGETTLLDQLRATGWVVDQPRADLHPAFGT